MSNVRLAPDACGCCAGTDVETPMAITNAPGLTTIAYRAGTWDTFRQSILARLSSAEHPALAGLQSREGDDFTIALADGFSVMADVLTFYQERLANESFLRTATERRSIVELARLIGYTPAPGVAAETWLAFTLEEARGAPTAAAQPVTIPVGTRVQSVPGPDELPQTFETVAPIVARVACNAIPVQTRVPQPIVFGLTEAYLDGTGLQLAAGDIVLIVGPHRRRFPGSERWDIRVLTTVEADEQRRYTRVAWKEPLGHVTPHVDPADPPAELFVFRQRAALFGHNAPDPSLLSASGTNLDSLVNRPASGRWTWKNHVGNGTEIDLDQAYPKIAPGSWVALVNPAFAHLPSSLPGYVELYNVSEVAFPSRSDFGLSTKITRITPDTTEHLTRFALRPTLALAHSEVLRLAERPLHDPLYGDVVALAHLVRELVPGQAVAVSGRRQHLRVRPDAGTVTLRRDNGTSVDLAVGDRLALGGAPTRRLADGSRAQLAPDALLRAIASRDVEVLRWPVLDIDGSPGTIDVGARAFTLDPARSTDTPISEVAFVADAADGVTLTRERTVLRLGAALKHCYDRETVRINANVAPAGHGESISELLGSGDAGRANQRFLLKQAPMTWRIADTPSGRAATLAIQVGDALWRERPSLYGAMPRDRVFAIQTQDDGSTTVRFGDGIEGARLPTGQQNIRASYRKGLGVAGNVAAGRLTTLLTRPLGVTATSNPEAASGGEDAEPLEAARQNAPLTVRTLDRAVSLDDYADFARGFAGIAKAHATWIPYGRARGVHLTVAGPGGVAIESGGRTWTALMDALRRYGDPLVPLSVQSYATTTFRLAATVKVHADAITDDVLAQVRLALQTAFSFDARDFGQTVSIDEVVSIAHTVTGVEAVDVDVLRRTTQPVSPAVRPRLFAALPQVSGAAVTPAALLLLDATTLTIGAMP